MRKVILSIKPEYADKIFSGEKSFEYRKKIYKDRAVSTIIVYSSFPICKIIGEFKVEQIIQDSPSNIWERTKYKSGIDERSFFNYFSNTEHGYALQITNATLYEFPKELRDIYFSPAPQSFAYLK